MSRTSSATLPHHNYQLHLHPPHLHNVLPPRTHRKTRHHLATPLNNISLHIAVLFVLGSIAWVVNGVYTQFPASVVGSQHAETVATWAAFAGGWLFQTGAFLTLVEASNTAHDPPQKDTPVLAVVRKSDASGKKRHENYRTLNLHPDLKSTGYYASLVQIFAASIFTFSVVTGVWAADFSHPLAIGIFWIPQILGGSGFVVAALLYMKEVGFLKVDAIGWHVAAWNLVGAMGFLLCGLFGCWDGEKYHWAEEASAINNFYGGIAFLVGSCAQLVEVLMT
ncbi:hypothetical protein DFJ77DRAFT_129056 [Powellomyces hirtus]|nr:hypothetical protein DFJ77DRAFT_129056 [Powellomyces hirtus]